MYEGLGYRIESVIEGYYDDGEAACAMTLSLTAHSLSLQSNPIKG